MSGVGEPVGHVEMVVGIHFQVFGLEAVRLALLREVPRLPLERLRFAAADGADDRPVEVQRQALRAVGRRGLGGEPEVLLKVRVAVRLDIEDAADRNGAPDHVRRQPVIGRPVGRHHHAGQVPAGRMAADVDASRIAAVVGDVVEGPDERAAHLVHDVGDRDRGAQLVFRQHRGAAGGDHRLRHLAVDVLVHGPPVAAVDEEEHRRAGPGRGEDVENLPRRVPVGDVQTAGQTPARRGASPIAPVDVPVDAVHRQARQPFEVEPAALLRGHVFVIHTVPSLPFPCRPAGAAARSRQRISRRRTIHPPGARRRGP